MQKIVINVIVLTGLLAGQSYAHLCNAAAIQRKDQVQSSHPPACTNSSGSCNRYVVREQLMRPDGILYTSKASRWTSYNVVESINETQYGWSNCGHGSSILTMSINVGGSFQLTIDWNNAGFTYTTPAATTINIMGQLTLAEANHRYRWVRWTKTATGTLSGTTTTYACSLILGVYQTSSFQDTDTDSIDLETDVYYIAECCDQDWVLIMKKHIIAVVGIILSGQVYALENAASELYGARLEVALFKESR